MEKNAHFMFHPKNLVNSGTKKVIIFRNKKRLFFIYLLRMEVKAQWKQLYLNYYSHWSEEGFQAMMGLSVLTVDLIYKHCKNQIPPEHLLMALNFLKEYRTNAAMADTWNMTEKAYRTQLWKTLQLLDEVLPEVCEFFLLLIV